MTVINCPSFLLRTLGNSHKSNSKQPLESHEASWMEGLA